MLFIPDSIEPGSMLFIPDSIEPDVVSVKPRITRKMMDGKISIIVCSRTIVFINIKIDL